MPSSNSFKNTFCVFNEMEISAIKGFTPNFKSDSGSQYFYTEEGMFRLSNHWGRLANSKWRLIAEKPETKNKVKLGFATWKSFYPDNNWELLYYLEIDYDQQTVLYQHKNNPNYDQKAVLRNAIDTKKRIKQVRNILNLTHWADYYPNESIDQLRKKIGEQLVNTNKTLEEIKRSLQ